jgi:hypothetical protein
MEQQIDMNFRYSDPEERRSWRTAFPLPASIRHRMETVATALGVSENEVLVSCLKRTLYNDQLVFELIKRAISAQRDPAAEAVPAEDVVRSHFLLPMSIKERLEEIRVEVGAPRRYGWIIVITGLQYGLQDAQLLREIKERAESRKQLLALKRRLAVTKEGDINRAA